MDKRFIISEGALKIIYIEYKEFLIPLIVILLSVFLGFFVIFPQFQEYLSMQQQAEQTSKRIESLRKNISTLSTIDADNLSQDYDSVARVLPSEKDFIGVLEAISKASAVAGVKVADFSFSVGNLATPSASLGSRPSLDLNLSISGDYSQIKTFLTQVGDASPVAEVRSFNSAADSASIGVSFFYTALPQTLQVQYDSPPPLLTDSDKQLLDRFRTWQNSISSNSASFIAF